jgi:Zn-dependent protease with chaperone function
VTLRDNEYMADESALRITNDIKSARSSLMKICNGNLDSASHFFDLAGKHLPAMTLRARLEEMQRRYNAYLGIH